MKRTIQIIGGTVITVVAVILVLSVYRGTVFTELLSSIGEGTRTEIPIQQEVEEAILTDTVMAYKGSITKQTGREYALFEEIQIKDPYAGYEITLTEALQEKRVSIKKMTVCKEGRECTDAIIDRKNGILCMDKAGIYQVEIVGLDAYNNTIRDSFLLAVNREVTGL